MYIYNTPDTHFTFAIINDLGQRRRAKGSSYKVIPVIQKAGKWQQKELDRKLQVGLKRERKDSKKWHASYKAARDLP